VCVRVCVCVCVCACVLIYKLAVAHECAAQCLLGVVAGKVQLR